MVTCAVGSGRHPESVTTREPQKEERQSTKEKGTRQRPLLKSVASGTHPGSQPR